MSFRLLLILFSVASLNVCSLALDGAKDGSHNDGINLKNQNIETVKSIRDREVYKLNIIAQLFQRIKNYSNQSFFNLTDVEANAISRRTSSCLEKKPKKKTMNGGERPNKCIIVPPDCLTDEDISSNDKSSSNGASFLFEADSLYRSQPNTESLRILSLTLNLKLHKRGAQIIKRSNITLNVYGITDEPSELNDSRLLYSSRVTQNKNRWIKIQLGRQFSNFRRSVERRFNSRNDVSSTNDDNTVWPFGITLFLQDNKNRYFRPEYLFYEHRCAKSKNAKSSFSMPHLMVAQNAVMKKFTATGFNFLSRFANVSDVATKNKLNRN